MKRLAIIGCLLIVGITAIQADDWRENRHSVSVTIGSPSLMQGGKGIFSDMFNGNNNTLTLYGTYGVHYNYNILKWLRVGGSALYSGYQSRENNGEPLNRDYSNEVILLGRLDFTYLNRRYVRLYSGGGIGVGGDFQKLVKQDSEGHINIDKPAPDWHFAWSVTPIGVEAGGEHVYALTELSIGHTEIIRAGVGVRF